MTILRTPQPLDRATPDGSEATATEPKNIVICCDGTGNEVNAHAYSNVVKMYVSLDKRDHSKQLCYYDPGLGTLGTPGFETRTFTSITRLMGLALGYGLRQNLKDAYCYLMNNYAPGDRVFLFGFSRGAYTVRALAGLLHQCGLLEKGSDNLIDHAIKRYFERPLKTPDWHAMARFKKFFSRKCDVHFIGVWDTVKTIGLFRRSLVLPHTADLKGVAHGRHAVSLNEQRSKYPTNLWYLPNDENFAQVWFAGVHSDIGGGYTEAGLSDIAFCWMLCEARKFGLMISEPDIPSTAPDPTLKMHNPLLPYFWILGWRRRTIPVIDGKMPVPWIHESVKTRALADSKFDAQCRKQIPANAVYVTTTCEHG